jgi:DNA-binding response OmpR family regulator
MSESEAIESPKVLIIEDSTVQVLLYRRVLEELNCELVVAHNGKEGIELARKELPDLVLLDIMMPEVNGFEVCAILKQDPATASIPVIFISSRSDLADLKEGLEAGAVDFLRKPVVGGELLARVKANLRFRALQDELICEKQKTAMLEMAGAVAHNFSQPLTVLLGSLQLLERRLSKATATADVRELMNSISEAAQRIASLTKLVSSLSRFETMDYLGDLCIVDLEGSAKPTKK